jgi:hypothetical protein
MGLAAAAGAAVSGRWRRVAALLGRAHDGAQADLERVLHEADFGPGGAVPLEELKKVARVVRKRHAGGDAPHEILLVLDATVGGNAEAQARAFAAALPLTGLVVTKLDDLELFDPVRYAHRLVSD